MKKIILITLKSALALVALTMVMGANCVTSGNIVILQEIPDFNAQTANTLTAENVNLLENEDWQDHKEDINSIDDIGFACRITNHESSAASGQLYVSKLKEQTTVESIKDNAILVLDGITVNPGETREIKWGESHDFIMNFESVKDVIFSENFWVYFIAAETPFEITVDDIVLIMSINGKP
jgi:hypothetical protein